MRTSAAVFLAAIAASFLALTGTATAASRSHASLAGTWSGRYGGTYSGTFTIHWKQTGSSLHGSITLSKPSGTYGITGSLHGGKIKFGAVGAGATYTGSVSGKSMSGSYQTAQGGGTWSAHKS